MNIIQSRNREIEAVAKAISKSEYLVGFTGAGISTESGLPDFRGPNGVWTRRDKGLPPIPTKPLELIEPNAAHHAFVELQNLRLLKFLISQNIDNLHLKSGIKLELLAELHGNQTLMKCLVCDSRFSKAEIGWDNRLYGRGHRTSPIVADQPQCLNCQGRIISSVVNFGDPMPEKDMELAEDHANRCDVILVVGSTLSVYPAANFPVLAKRNGAKLIIINEGPTELDEIADIRVESKAGEFLPFCIERVKEIFSGGD